MKTIVLAVSLASSLAACGGGGSSGPTSDQSAAINQAMTNIVQTLPAPSKPFLGAFASVNGVSIGYVSGTSEDDVAKHIANNIAQDSLNNPDAYRAMLSDKGLSIVVMGADTGQKSSITGVPLRYPDITYIAKIGKGNVIELVRA